MNFELISEEEYENLPEDDDDCFVAFEATCRRNMNRMISSDTTREFDKNVRQQYMAAVSAVGRECSIPNTETEDYTEDSFDDEFRRFSLAVHGEVARIRIRCDFYQIQNPRLSITYRGSGTRSRNLICRATEGEH